MAQLEIHEQHDVIDLGEALSTAATAVPLDRIASELPWLYMQVTWSNTGQLRNIIIKRLTMCRSLERERHCGRVSGEGSTTRMGDRRGAEYDEPHDRHTARVAYGTVVLPAGTLANRCFSHRFSIFPPLSSGLSFSVLSRLSLSVLASLSVSFFPLSPFAFGVTSLSLPLSAPFPFGEDS